MNKKTKIQGWEREQHRNMDKITPLLKYQNWIKFVSGKLFKREHPEIGAISTSAWRRGAAEIWTISKGINSEPKKLCSLKARREENSTIAHGWVLVRLAGTMSLSLKCSTAEVPDCIRATLSRNRGIPAHPHLNRHHFWSTAKSTTYVDGYPSDRVI